eukprot:Platyproteum_vivax@DN10478_c0_g1_i1.p1
MDPNTSPQSYLKREGEDFSEDEGAAPQAKGRKRGKRRPPDLQDILDELILRLQRKDRGGWFHDPVRREEVPDYYDIIKQPMCFSIIKDKIRSHIYCDVFEFKKDVDTMVLNAKTYNPPHSQITKSAEAIGQMVGGRMLSAAQKRFQAFLDWQEANPTEPLHRPTPPPPKPITRAIEPVKHERPVVSWVEEQPEVFARQVRSKGRPPSRPTSDHATIGFIASQHQNRARKKMMQENPMTVQAQRLAAQQNEYSAKLWSTTCKMAEDMGAPSALDIPTATIETPPRPKYDASLKEFAGHINLPNNAVQQASDEVGEAGLVLGDTSRLGLELDSKKAAPLPMLTPAIQTELRALETQHHIDLRPLQPFIERLTPPPVTQTMAQTMPHMQAPMSQTQMAPSMAGYNAMYPSDYSMAQQKLAVAPPGYMPMQNMQAFQGVEPGYLQHAPMSKVSPVPMMVAPYSNNWPKETSFSAPKMARPTMPTHYPHSHNP